MLLLNWAEMSGLPGSLSAPVSAFVSAAAYQVPGSGAPVKSSDTDTAPAEPSTAEPALQGSGSIDALTRMGTLLTRHAPARSAAYWNAFKRAWPSVVAGLPPTGTTGVVSLKPSPGPSVLLMMMVAAPALVASATRLASITRTDTLRRCFMTRPPYLWLAGLA